MKIFVIFRCRNRNLLIPQKFYHFLEKQNFVELFFSIILQKISLLFFLQKQKALSTITGTVCRKSKRFVQKKKIQTFLQKPNKNFYVEIFSWEFRDLWLSLRNSYLTRRYTYIGEVWSRDTRIYVTRAFTRHRKPNFTRSHSVSLSILLPLRSTRIRVSFST